MTPGLTAKAHKECEWKYNLLVKNGYVPIGMDHYVKPDDELHKALKNKKLHRNFQGYASREQTGQVYAFGATAISQLQNAYSQNARSIKKYIEHLNNGHLPVFRGYELTKDEIIIRKVISEIMCNHYINWDQIAYEMNVSAKKIREIVNYNPQNLQSFIDDGMITHTDKEIEVTSKGFFLIRNIAMEFDPQLNQENQKYSRTI